MKKLLILFVLSLFSMLLSAQGYQYLVVDGIQVHFTEVRFFDQYGEGGGAKAYIVINQTVDLTGNPEDIFSGDILLQVREDVGSELTFGIINIEITGGVSIMGHCYDIYTGKHIYTTAAGIDETAADFNSTWTAPSDYGYMHNDYLYYPGDGGESQETTFMPSSVSYALDGTLNISLNVETLNSAYYWDGNENTRNDFVKSVNQENPALFPAGTPVIGITYLPLYVTVNKTLVAETYVFALKDSTLSSASQYGDYFTGTDYLPSVLGYIDGLSTATVTFTFDSVSDAFFIGRATHNSPWGGWQFYSLFIPQFVSDTVESGGVYSFTMKDYNNGWTNLSTLSGFTRLNVGDPYQEATFTGTDGSEAYSATFYYERVK